jgi:hypothetical protein
MTSVRAPSSTSVSDILRRLVRWVFLNRRTGHLTVVQWPNIPLSVFIVASAALDAFRPKGGVESFARVLADVALFVWATDELLRGVNPFRRALGLGVIIATCITLSLQAH